MTFWLVRSMFIIFSQAGIIKLLQIAFCLYNSVQAALVPVCKKALTTFINHR